MIVLHVLHKCIVLMHKCIVLMHKCIALCLLHIFDQPISFINVCIVLFISVFTSILTNSFDYYSHTAHFNILVREHALVKYSKMAESGLVQLYILLDCIDIL